MIQPRTIRWPAPSPVDADAADAAAGLRERKKRQLRQRLTDTATALFMERGFDAVKVAEVAAACGVSEKTVYNYFPTKESLLIDRWDATMSGLRSGLAAPDAAPVEVALRILTAELEAMTSWLAAQPDPEAATTAMRRFGELIRSTASLRAHQLDAAGRLIALVAELLAARAGLAADDPEPRIAAAALLGLWEVQFTSLRRVLAGTSSAQRIHDQVMADVRRAAQVLEAGLRQWPPATGACGAVPGPKIPTG
jgi:AcrR family transcriptional regulator